MIKQDKLSKFLIAISMMLTMYLATFETTTLVMFPAILLVVGLSMEMFLERKQEYSAESLIQERTMRHLGYYTILGLVGMFVTGYVINYVKQMAVGLNPNSAIIYATLMAVAEEQFFRGFVTDALFTYFSKKNLQLWFLSFDGATVALVTSAFIFMGYHTARYGVQPDAMMYVFAGGLILSWVAYKSQRISPCMLAHILNNIASVLGV